jgi:anti-sigma regulatory factor (Ser/Thr protein kinase)
MRLDLRSGERSLGVARDRLGAWLAATGVPETEFWEILTAAGEACANALEHSGTDLAALCPAWIEAWIQGDEVHLMIGDRGRWREPDPAGIGSGRRGRGRLLMAGLMDTMTISTGPEGTRVAMSKSLPRLEGRGIAIAGRRRVSLRLMHAQAG